MESENHISEIMSDVCPYHNVGFCKQKDKCPKYHSQEDCQLKGCKEKTCRKRHRRKYRDNANCIFLQSETCAFLHFEESAKSDNVEVLLQKLIESIEKKDLEIQSKLDEKDDLIRKLTEDLADITERVKALEQMRNEPKIKCDICEFEGKNKKGLDMHKSKMHNKINNDIEIANEDIPTQILPVIESGKCNICKFKSNTPKAFYNHMLKAHDVSDVEVFRSINASDPSMGFKLKPK